MSLLITLLEHLVNIVAMIFMLRILLQIGKANINNPIASFINRFTAPVINGLRKFAPDLGSFNLASLLFILLIVFAKFYLIDNIINANFSGEYYAFGTLVGLFFANNVSIAGLVVIFSNMLLIMFIGLMIVSFISAGQYNPAADFLRQVTEPLLRPLRKIIPPIGGTIDITPMIVLFVLFYLQNALISLGAKILG